MASILDYLRRPPRPPSADVPHLDPSSPEARSGATMPMYVYGNPPGLTKPGNIDLRRLLPVQEPGTGRWGTVYSSNDEINGRETVYPGIVNGAFRSQPDAYKNAALTGRNLGEFSNPKDATNYAVKLHKDWENPGITGLAEQRTPVTGAPYPSSEYAPLNKVRKALGGPQ